MVGAAGIEPATLCLEVVIPRFLPIAAAVSGLFGEGCSCGFASILGFCLFHSVSGKGPYSFHYGQKICTHGPQLACDNDLEGIVAKEKYAPYQPETRWLKIRNHAYSQWAGSEELFERERGGNPDMSPWDDCLQACASAEI